MSSFVRESKYRHIVVSVKKKEFHYEQLRVVDHHTDNNSLSVNSKFLAYTDVSGGGVVKQMIH
jgi:hypothetical protein